jgi:putative ABC transport system substrate-binding protein
VIVRRYLVTLIALVTVSFPLSAWTQQTGRLPKVGILSPGKKTDMGCGPIRNQNEGPGPGCFVEGLRALGYDDGRNVVFEYRFAEGAIERLPALAAELVSLRPDVIYTFTTGGAVAAGAATSAIPIVVGPAGEITLERLARNFARPVANVTGVTLSSVEQDQKCLQLLKELAPRTSRVAVLVNPGNPNFRSYPDVLRPAASQLGITLTGISARNETDLPQAFAMIRASGADAMFMVDDAALAGTSGTRRQILKWAMDARLPVASSSSRVAADGGLVSLGTDNAALARRAATYVHRILGGAKVAELPVERPTTYKLSVNRKTAAALGLTIPQPVLARADEVIQ